MPSPVHFAAHGEPHLAILTWLGTYCAFTPGVRAADNATIRLDLDNEPQPDALLRIEPEAGGHSHLSEDDYVEGAPELVIEIVASSATYDMHDKLRAYRRNGVQEYLVWRFYSRCALPNETADSLTQRRIFIPAAPRICSSSSPSCPVDFPTRTHNTCGSGRSAHGS